MHELGLIHPTAYLKSFGRTTAHLHSHQMTQMWERGKSFSFWTLFFCHAATWIQILQTHRPCCLLWWRSFLSIQPHTSPSTWQHDTLAVLIIICLSTAISAKTPVLVTSKNIYILTEVLGCSASDVLQIQRRSQRNDCLSTRCELSLFPSLAQVFI